ncbi:MAG: hypothetical protein K6E91_15075 [Butyrivibrio sp.]|nr:hypothetical protein [Butyrivibrio sp.]
MFIRRINARFLAALMSFALTFSAFSGGASYAANAGSVTFQSAEYNEEAVDKAFKAIQTARKTGSQSDMDKGDVLVNALSPTNKVRLYLRLSGDYYRNNFRNAGFKFFDAKKYLEANPDACPDANPDTDSNARAGIFQCKD